MELDCIDKLHGEYCNDCQKCKSLKCKDCMFYDEYYGCDDYREHHKCILFKYKREE